MPPTQLLVPIDFSENSERALDYACDLASKLDATVHLVNGVGAGLPELSVALTDEMFETIRSSSLAKLEELVQAREGRARFGKRIVLLGDARDAIIDALRATGADLIVMGTHGRRGLSRIVLGSVAEDIVRRAPCPVLTVRGLPPAEPR